MAITYTEEQRELVQLVRDVARNEVMPHVAAADKAGECPRELYQWGFDLGLHMVEIPEQFGGMGLTYETCAMMFEELAWVDAAYADTFVTNFVAFRNILLNGTEEQARHFVEKTEAGGFAAFCLTEANAGSDVAAMRTTAVLDGDEYVLNGADGGRGGHVGAHLDDLDAGERAVTVELLGDCHRSISPFMQVVGRAVRLFASLSSQGKEPLSTDKMKYVCKTDSKLSRKYH